MFQTSLFAYYGSLSRPARGGMMGAQHEVLGLELEFHLSPVGTTEVVFVPQPSLRDWKQFQPPTQHFMLGYLQFVPPGQTYSRCCIANPDNSK